MILINRYKRHETKFQGCWCAFAFHKEAFDPCIDFMEQSTLKLKNKKQDIKSTKIFGGRVIEVEDFKDLGTWNGMEKILSNDQKN